MNATGQKIVFGKTRGIRGVWTLAFLAGSIFLISTGCQNPYMIRKSHPADNFARMNGVRTDSAPFLDAKNRASETTVRKIERGQIDYSQDTFVYGGGNSAPSSTSSTKTGSAAAAPPRSNSAAGSNSVTGRSAAGFADYVGADYVGADYAGVDYVGADNTGADYAGASGAAAEKKVASASTVQDDDLLKTSTFGDPRQNGAASEMSDFPQLTEEGLLTDPPADFADFVAGSMTAPVSGIAPASATAPVSVTAPTASESTGSPPADGSSLPRLASTASGRVNSSSGSNVQADRKSSSILMDDSEMAKTSLPPTGSDFPEFARNAYEALEPSEDQWGEAIEPDGKATPPRERESITVKEKSERELKEEYNEWLALQKANQKEKEKIPRYLQPLGNDRAVFDDPNSPFSRQMKAESEKEHKFIREITAADLNLMSDVSSTRELMDWEKEQDMPVDWSKYSAKTLYNKWRDFLGMGANEKEALAIMKKGTLTQMEYEKTGDRKQLREAASLYEKAGKKWPDSILEEDALFYAAECHFHDRNYAKAKTFYKALITKYSNSILRQDAMERLYCIGVYWVKCSEEDPEIIGRFEGKERPRFSDFAGAKDAFEIIFNNDISVRGRAPDALFALANAYMRRGVEQGDASFESAAKYYQRLYEFYPACKYVDKAYPLAMLALYQSYRGPFYDSTPLKKAEEIARIAQRAGKGDPEVITEQLRLIKEKQAEYLLVRGEYYEKKKIYAAARNYYNQLVAEYPESEFAVQAAGRYNVIRENPAEADQFALIRPVAPFLPKSKNKYYEDRPNERIDSALARSEGRAKENLTNPDFTALEKSAGRDEEESDKTLIH